MIELRGIWGRHRLWMQVRHGEASMEVEEDALI